MSDPLVKLVALGHSVGCAESLTGGLVVARLIDTPGASTVVRGGVVSYATDVKASVLGVDAQLLTQEGAVHPDVAAQMAQGARKVLHADWGVATTGVAGPDPQGGMPVGRVYVAVAGPGAAGVQVERLDLSGDRNEIRCAAVDAALALLDHRLDEASSDGSGAAPDDGDDGAEGLGPAGR